MRLRTPYTSLVLAAALMLCGCGSKISEANYYRVHYGMTEKQVEDVLGPAHEERTDTPSATQPGARKVKTWTRGELVIRVVFEGGIVVERTGRGNFKA